MMIHGQKGYTLLFAIIVSAIVLSIAAFIASISRKQMILASVARDSTMAIYAADSGIECVAQAFQNKFAYFSCNGQNLGIAFDVNVNKNDVPDMHFHDSVKQTPPIPIFFGSTCALVTITIGRDDSSPFNPKSIVESRGYNMSDGSSCPLAGPRTTERAIRLTYLEYTVPEIIITNQSQQAPSPD